MEKNLFIEIKNTLEVFHKAVELSIDKLENDLKIYENQLTNIIDGAKIVEDSCSYIAKNSHLDELNEEELKEIKNG